MPKAYWIARVDVTDPERYQRYLAANVKAFAKYDVTFLAKGGKAQVMHGQGRARNVVIEFPDFQSAVDCYNSPEYQFALEERGDAGIVDVVIVEGPEGS
jgi:uncharacterized protein (DUF1330 family)